MPSKYVYKKKILNKHRLNNLYKGNNNTDIVVFIDIPSKKKSVRLLEQYNDKILGSCVFDIYDKIVQIKHLNYLNKLENLDKILSVLTQHHNLIWLHLSIKSINDELLQVCVDNNFKDIYISNVSLDNKSISTSLCMKYDKKKDDSDQFQLAKNLLKQYNTNKQYCTANATFKLKTAKYLKNLVYASSSSVYGGNAKIPFSISDNVDRPISLYAATKKSNELLSYSYSHLFGINQVGLRFFTVYGPWGRPDMALFLFTESIIKGNPIKIFNYGDMSRDFTYIDDIVDGTISALDKCPSKNDKVPHRVYNLGNDKPEQLVRLIELIEYHTGKKAIRKLETMQPGDVKNTLADIKESKKDLDFNPKVKIEEGVPLFIDWYREYFKL